MSMSYSKYHNKRTVYEGQTFMSKREAGYARTLDALKYAKDPKEKVVSYETQVPFQIELNGKKICKYIADFVVKYKDGHTEVVDPKGFKTALYRLKKKLVEAQYGIEIKEI
jgi:hypothetical protein